jgi:surface protein
MSLVKIGATIKWTDNTVPSNRFVQANPRGTGNEWFVIVDDSTKSNITDYAFGNSNFFIPSGESTPIPFNNIVTTLVTNMFGMFYGATAFNQPIGSWDTSIVQNMFGMFYSATAFNQPIGSWDTSNVQNMFGIFYSATAFNQPISAWETSNVTDTRSMFYGANSFNTSNIALWDRSSMLNSYESMFEELITYRTYISSNISNYNDGDSSYIIIQNTDEESFTIALTIPFVINGSSFSFVNISTNGFVYLIDISGNFPNYNTLLCLSSNLLITGTDFIRYKEINDKFIIVDTTTRDTNPHEFKSK